MTQDQTQTNQGPDQSVINLAKAIRQKESGGNYSAVGDVGTSTGAFQFQPDTWKLYAKDILGDENAQMTKQNQNAVVYGKLKKWKDSGWNAAQSAAAWNAGEKRAEDGSWANHVGETEINGQKVKYNTPQYVKEVMDNYQTIKGGSQIQPLVSQKETQDTPTSQDNSQDPSLVSQLNTRAQTAGSSLSDLGNQLSGKPGEQNWWSDLLHVGGSVAGGVGDIINAGLNQIPGVKGAEDWVGGQVAKLADTDTGKSVVGAINDFRQSHPELSQDIGDVGNIATLIPMVKGISMVGDSVLGGTLKNIATKGIMKDIAKQTGTQVSEDSAKFMVKNQIMPTIEKVDGKYIYNVKDAVNKLSAVKDTVSKDVRMPVYDYLDALDGKPYTPGKVSKMIHAGAQTAGMGIGGAIGGTTGGIDAGLLEAVLGKQGGGMADKAAQAGLVGIKNKVLQAPKKGLIKRAVKGVTGAGLMGGASLYQNKNQ